jgi:hypothetical protein
LVCPVSTRTCQFVAVQKAGEPCGGLGSAGACAAGLSCVLPTGVDPRIYDGPGTCRARGAPGAACDDQKPCALSLGCHDGTCQVELFTACGMAALGR